MIRINVNLIRLSLTETGLLLATFVAFFRLSQRAVRILFSLFLVSKTLVRNSYMNFFFQMILTFSHYSTAIKSKNIMVRDYNRYFYQIKRCEKDHLLFYMTIWACHLLRCAHITGTMHYSEAFLTHRHHVVRMFASVFSSRENFQLTCDIWEKIYCCLDFFGDVNMCIFLKNGIAFPILISVVFFYNGQFLITIFLSEMFIVLLSILSHSIPSRSSSDHRVTQNASLFLIYLLPPFADIISTKHLQKLSSGLASTLFFFSLFAFSSEIFRKSALCSCWSYCLSLCSLSDQPLSLSPSSLSSPRFLPPRFPYLVTKVYRWLLGSIAFHLITEQQKSKR